MVMSTKKIVRGIDESLNKAVSEINASTPKPEMKDTGAELKAAVAPKNDLSFAEKFKANRMAGNKTFTYNGKTYTTKMAGEGAAPKPTAPKNTPPKPADVSESTKRFVKNLPLKPKPTTTAKPTTAAKPQRDTYSSGVGGARSAAAEAARKSGKAKGILDSAFGHWVSQTDRNFQERQKKKYGKAAGGSIDGAAIRGKTRAVRKGK